jgi:hypothetical protein
MTSLVKLFMIWLQQNVSQLNDIQFYHHGRHAHNVRVISDAVNDANVTLEM